MGMTTEQANAVLNAYVDIGGTIRYWADKDQLSREEQELLTAHRMTKRDFEREFVVCSGKENDDE